MKIIFLSDIHSNWNYLSQVKSFIESEKADFIYFLGDAIGYYDEPNEVLNWLKEISAFCIKGNHEKYFLDELMCDSKLDNIYQVSTNKNIITSENKEFISKWKDKLEVMICGKKFLIVHGDFNSSENHIYDVTKIDEKILKQYDYYIYAHTHIPLIQYTYGCCVINPGSIGQPRDYTEMPSFVTVDLSKNEVKIKKIEVEKDRYLLNLEEKIFDQKVINILKRNKYGTN
ncbi:metallophosphoesterase family protein [Aliarcobacter butzleri]|uniref:metallophosphoesterase family protein n=1 Tax=Aliarcobacter butzleri TaxID=28197 RepID=UPI00263D9A7A|nr:YfcE family phosphodiesterase [Aliarcobacter butzleri]MDN5096029.1 YfcE family phosphodiesterase [Aliarcobacter butzleri]